MDGKTDTPFPYIIPRTGDFIQVAKIIFIIDKPPIAKARPRFTAKNGVARAVTEDKTRDYEDLIRRRYKREHGKTIFEYAIYLDITFHMPMPASTKAAAGDPHTKKPDIDNLIKLVTDALNGMAYKDDNQIAQITAKKIYSTDPGTHIIIAPYPGNS